QPTDGEPVIQPWVLAPEQKLVLIPRRPILIGHDPLFNSLIKRCAFYRKRDRCSDDVRSRLLQEIDRHSNVCSRFVRVSEQDEESCLDSDLLSDARSLADLLNRGSLRHAVQDLL